MNEPVLKVFLVDDDAAVRDSLSCLIQSEGYVVEAFADARAFLESTSPDAGGCVVVDLRMPGMDGMQLQEELVRRGYHLPIVFLTGHGDIPTSVRAIKAGAVDFLTKPVPGSVLLASIVAALNLAETRTAKTTRNSDAASLFAGLTQREQAVMQLVVTGMANKEIGKELGISHRTVEIHKAHVMRKTGAATLLELVRMARDAGIIE